MISVVNAVSALVFSDLCPEAQTIRTVRGWPGGRLAVFQLSYPDRVTGSCDNQEVALTVLKWALLSIETVVVD